MNYGGDAADQIVRYSLDGVDHGLRLSGTLAKHLAVMDSTATSLSMDNHIPVLVFALKDPYNIVRALRGEKIGTIVKED